MGATQAAIVGTGFMGWVHLESLRRSNIPVCGILGSTPAKSRDAADSWGLATGYESLDQLLNDPRVTSVHVTTPNRYHFQLTREALAALSSQGKPSSRSDSDCRLLIDCAPGLRTFA